jgi:AraC family transcriptional regulator
MTNATYSISKQDLTPQPVLVVRRKVARSEIAAAIGGALPHIFLYAQQHGIALSGHPFTRYLDAGPGLITMEPGMRITKPSAGANAIDPAWLKTSGEAEVISDTLPGGPAAVTMHTGPYTTLQEAYAALETWMEAQGLAPAGAPWEAYITDPGEVPDPKDWKTEVFWPVQPKSA